MMPSRALERGARRVIDDAMHHHMAVLDAVCMRMRMCMCVRVCACMVHDAMHGAIGARLGSAVRGRGRG